MGVFDNIQDDSFAEDHQFGPQEGFAGVLLAASACDGHIGDEEFKSLVTILARMKLYQQVSDGKFNTMMDRLMGVLKRGGPEKLMDTCLKTVPPELEETVFANACDIVLADGVVDSDEKEFIDDLMKKLGIKEERATEIVQVMIYKNKG